jgi:hypothetical protein
MLTILLFSFMLTCSCQSAPLTVDSQPTVC